MDVLEKSNMDKKKLVSVIVPIYNVKPYINDCIESIINQTYGNLDIVLVDDGSNDGSESICEYYKKSDNRINVVHKSNGGLVSARKQGVICAKGDFICWVDADDWIEPKHIETLVRLQREKNADIVATAHYHDIGGNSSIVKNGIANGIYQIEDIISTMLYHGPFYVYGIAPHQVTKLFKTDIIKTTQLEVDDAIIAGEDAAVVYPSLLMAKSIMVSDYAGYHYVQRPGSITKVSYNDEQERVELLLHYLKKAFYKFGVWPKLERQLAIYGNYLFSLRDIKIFDRGQTEKILKPYGGLREGDKIIIYGAGVLGQKIYTYLNDDKRVQIIDWLDKNWEHYRNNNFQVNSPECLLDENLKYDYVIIANISEVVAISIKHSLLEIGISENKIRWFTDEFKGL